MVALTALVGAIAALLTAVELSSLGDVPRVVGRAFPLLAVMACVWVVRQWRASGRLIALSSIGVRPVRLCVVGCASGLAAGLLILGLVRGLSAEERAGDWLFLEDGLVMSGTRVGGEVVDLRFAVLDAGEVVGLGGADRAQWDGTWRLTGGSGQIWSDRPRAFTPALPAPERWVEAMRLGTRERLARWVLDWVGCGLLCGLGVGLTMLGRPVWAIGISASWVPVSVGAMSAVYTGLVSPLVGVLAPLTVLLAGCAYVSWRTM